MKSKIALLAVGLILTSFAANATIIAADASSSPAYSGGSFANLDGGFGFQSWTVSTQGGGGSYIGGTGLGTTFGIYSGNDLVNPDSATAQRLFDVALAVGDEFRIDLGHTTIQSGGEVGISLFSGANLRFNLKTFGGEWRLYDGGASDFGTGMTTANNSPLTFRFVRGTDPVGYSVFLTQGANSYSGVGYNSNSGTMDISRIDIYSNEQGGGENLGFDNLRITAVPEPSVAGLLGLGLLLLRRLRRK